MKKHWRAVRGQDPREDGPETAGRQTTQPTVMRPAGGAKAAVAAEKPIQTSQ